MAPATTVFVRRGIFYRHVDVRPDDAAGAQAFLREATFLPVRRWRFVVPFLRMSARIEAQLQQSPGLIRYGVRADIARRRFWTLSVWTDPEAVRAFVGAEPHRTAVAHFAAWAGAGAAFVRWPGSEASLDWEDALKRLNSPTFYYAGEDAH